MKPNPVYLKPGDVIPCDFEGKVTLLAEEVPIFRGGFGMSRNPKVGMGPPSFKSAAFAVGADGVKLPITMKYMF